MMNGQYALGLDFGTNSVRALIVDLADGQEVGTAVASYTSGTEGILLDPADPNVARQNPADYLEGMETAVRAAVRDAKKTDSGFDSLTVNRLVIKEYTIDLDISKELYDLVKEVISKLGLIETCGRHTLLRACCDLSMFVIVMKKC